MIVIDASTALAWAFNEDDFADRFADQLASERLLAPPIWRLEVVNVVLRNERQRLITPEQGNRILAALVDRMSIGFGYHSSVLVESTIQVVGLFEDRNIGVSHI